MTPPSSIPGLSNLSMPTPTVATGTTITGTPSTTNSTHRSPPQTPHSSNRVKSTTVSGPKENQSDVHSVVDKNTTEKRKITHQSSATTTAKNSQSSSQLHSQLNAPTTGSASAQHPIPTSGTGTRVSKPRDKQAKLRKRLKCCSQDQLVDQLIELVRSSAVPEKVITEAIPRVDMEYFISRCKSLREAIFLQLPEDAASATTPFDAATFRRCKKSLTVFKASVIAMGKTLVEASLWVDAIRYCVAAAEVNAQMPVWAEASHNKIRAAVLSKLDQFALRAATAITKSKDVNVISPDDHVRIVGGCRDVFPSVVAKLQGQSGGDGDDASLQRSRDFEDPMISTTQLDIDI